jgi:hypothetical protein
MRKSNQEVPKSSPARLRCAIYTRKSTEEGLDQDFNSHDAQREAAEAFIQSQRREGWIALPAPYDDGGFTGANMDRPALGSLLQCSRSRRPRLRRGVQGRPPEPGTAAPSGDPNTHAARRWGAQLTKRPEPVGETESSPAIGVAQRRSKATQRRPQQQVACPIPALARRGEVFAGAV